MVRSTRKSLGLLRSTKHPAHGPVPPAEPAEGRAAPPPKLTVDGVELTQAIQNMPHSVPLVAGKRTVVRVYLSATAPAPITVQGVLMVRRTSPPRPWRAVASMGPVTINPAENGQLRLKRESENRSLNFLLPTALCAAGGCEVKLASVFQTTPFRPLPPPTNAKRAVTFVTSAPLRVRILGIRFQGGTPPASIEPSALDFALIRSWLQRAYPVASVVWTRVTVDAPQAWPFNASTINAFVRGIRTTDVLGGMDARTHYYGLVSDGDGAFFMRGLASGIPTTPDPSTVASGPTGVNTWGWDTDGSYGDWYTGHELGHTFGRFHAEFCGAGGGAPYPFTNGQLSNADGAFVGFDVGDIARGLAPRALPGTVWHDVMSYCAFQWLSSFTYTGIRDRLVLEAALPAGATPPGAGTRAATRRRGKAMSTTGAIHVVAIVNVTRGTGHIQHVTPVPAIPAGREAAPAESKGRRTRGRAEHDVELRVYGAGDRVLGEVPASLIPDACLDPGDDQTGLVDTFLPVFAGATRIDLLLNGSAIASFVPAAPARAVQNIRTGRPAAPAARRAAEEMPANPVITWTDPGPAATARGARAEGAAQRVYTVQISTDEGETWQTVGFGLREPRATIDRDVLEGAEQVRVRITSTDGFRSASTEKTFKAEDL